MVFLRFLLESPLDYSHAFLKMIIASWWGKCGYVELGLLFVRNVRHVTRVYTRFEIENQLTHKYINGRQLRARPSF